MKFEKLSKFDYITLIPILLVSIILYNLTIHRINPFEFDTAVYYSIFNNLISTGKVLIPIVSRNIAYVCDPSLTCSYVHPDIIGQQIYEQLPPDYTSGITILFLPAFLHNLLEIFAKNNLSLNYFTQLYAAGASIMYGISSYFLLRLSNANLQKVFIYLLITFITNLTLIQISSNGIIGELYSSILLSEVAVITLLTFNNLRSLRLCLLSSLLLGISIECKITSVFPVFTIILIILINDYINNRELKRLIFAITAIALPKIIALLYYTYILDFSASNLLNYLYSAKTIYSLNANLGLNWGQSSISGQVNSLLSNELVRSIIFLSFIFYISSLLINIKLKNKRLLILNLVVLFALISSLIYPLTFKFPYTRIFSSFISLVPTCILLFIFSLQSIKILEKWKYLIPFIILIPLGIHTYFYRPMVFPLFKLLYENKFQPISNSYQSLDIPKDAVFLSPHFFSMPWDAYLSSVLDNTKPLDQHSIYSEQSYGGNSHHANTMKVNNIYMLETCRWEHCSKDKKISKYIKTGEKDIFEEIFCTLIPPKNIDSIYKIYSCSKK